MSVSVNNYTMRDKNIAYYFFQVIAENLCSEEIQGLKAMFTNMDTDKSGTITYEELRAGLQRLGSKLTEAGTRQLMEAVSHC
jgi:calcium-dependent protein kinase